MSVRKFRDRWGVDIRVGETRKRFRSPENSRAGALAFEARLRTEFSTTGKLELVEPPRLFRDAVEDWFATDVVANRTAAVQRQYRYMLNRLVHRFGDRPISSISTLDIERYKAALVAEKLSPSSIRNVLVVLSRFYTCALDWEWVSKRPKVNWPSVPLSRFDFLSHEECEVLRLAAQGTEWHDMIVCGYRTGLRRGELQALKWEDVDIRRGVITVRRSVSDGKVSLPKSKKERSIRMSPDLKAVLAARPRTAPYVFAGAQEPRTLRTPMERGLNRIVKASGLRRLTWHTLRHTFASLLVSAGVDLFVVMKLMGHSSIQMTLRYSHLAPAKLGDAIAALMDAEERELGARNGHQTDAKEGVRAPASQTIG